MNNIKLVSIDLAKNVFQVCGINQAGKPIVNKKVKRSQLLETVLSLKPKRIVMEACYTANYWGRKFQSFQFEVSAIPAQFVKAFVRGNKNDGNDALAIAEAAVRPNMRFVPIKTIEQQDLQTRHRVRERHIRNRTALINQIRGILSEYGVTIALGSKTVIKQIPLVLEDANNELSPSARSLLSDLSQELRTITETIKHDEVIIEQLSKSHDTYQRLMTVPGIGKILSSFIIASVGNGQQFKNGREFSAWIGLTPRQYASGDKSYLGKVSKRGNRTLRTLFIHGARAAFTRCKQRDHYLFQWSEKIAARSSKPKAWVALANKLARIVWAMLVKKTEFQYR
ncbi:transposase [Pleionea mediterranea]|uniref:Transposase n=3 Tax=Pleionea mediterranea TaxID=523701 RepID=A0A316F7I4_9GAMM|nr:transposase [Pleionea mediterranea]